VIYYLLDDGTPVLALLVYGKNEQTNPTPEQRKAMLRLVEALKIASRDRRREHGGVDVQA
jgi:hypothetical protein